MQVHRVIAIDGPAGSGKSTVSKGVARALGLDVLDTGAMYRAATVAALRAGLDLADEAAVTALVARTEIAVAEQVTIDGVDVTDAIRTPETTAAVSQVARIADVRALLIERQREWATVRHGGVIEGRDITSVVFPDAPVRVYLYADPEVRAQRRGAEETVTRGDLGERNIGAELESRDAKDTSLGRVVRPDQVPEGVTVIDTSSVSADVVIDQVLDLARRQELAR